MLKGFCMNVRNKELFYVSDKELITDKIVYKFMEEIAIINNVSDDLLQRAMQDKNTILEFRKRIDKATLEKRKAGDIEYYSLQGKYFGESIPLNEAKDCLIIF